MKFSMETFSRLGLADLLLSVFRMCTLAVHRPKLKNNTQNVNNTQCFVKRMCRLNRTATEAFEFVKIVTKYLDADDELDDICDLTILRQYEGNYLEILD